MPNSNRIVWFHQHKENNDRSSYAIHSEAKRSGPDSLVYTRVPRNIRYIFSLITCDASNQV